MPMPDGCCESHAVISLGPNDAIRDFAEQYGMPTTVPVLNTGGDPVGNNFSEMVQGTLLITIGEGIEFGGGFVQSYWTGSDSSGLAAEPDCEDWASMSGNGRTGSVNATDASWLSTSDEGQSCANERGILCVCW